MNPFAPLDLRPPLAALLLLTVLLPVSPATAAPEDELLEPDKAFSLSTRVLDANTLEATWKIAPGYYMYRDKFKFEVIEGPATLRPPLVPPGKKKDDPLFGSVETYTESVVVRLPLERRSGDAGTLALRIGSQGCNEPIGVCYPPIMKEVTFSLPAAAATRPQASPIREAATLKDLARIIEPSADEPEVVDPEKAFRVRVDTVDPDGLVARFEIADCCYLYRDKTSFRLTRIDGTPAAIALGRYALPPGKEKVDEFFGTTEVYYGGFEVRLPVSGLAAAGEEFALHVSYQGCSEKGVAICYPPTTKRFRIAASAGIVQATPLDSALTATSGGGTAPAPVKTETTKFVLSVLTAFGIGLLLTFTPCVLPMIPILSSVIVGSADRHITKLEGGMLSVAYVLGTAVTYTVAGVIAGTSGEQLQAYFQNVWAISIFSALFVLLALSMFGFYELQMPAFVQSYVHRHSSQMHARTRHVKGGAFIGVFIMGLLSALIVGACVSPLFISALGVAIANRDPVLGGSIMFSMALGMGVILIAIGIGAGFLLPQAGPWMERVKHVFGVMLLGVAIYLLGFLPEVPVLFLWAGLLIVTGVYLGATESLPKGASGWQYLWKGLGTFILVWGVLALLGGMAGNRDILNPLPLADTGFFAAGTGGSATAAVRDTAPLFEPVRNLQQLEGRLAEARAAGKPAILDYYATWCTDCVRMERSTFADPAVRGELRRRFVMLQADVTDPNDPESRAIKQRFGVYGPPAMLFFGPDGLERRELRTYGYKSAQDFLSLLRRI